MIFLSLHLYIITGIIHYSSYRLYCKHFGKVLFIMSLVLSNSFQPIIIYYFISFLCSFFNLINCAKSIWSKKSILQVFTIGSYFCCIFIAVPYIRTWRLSLLRFFCNSLSEDFHVLVKCCQQIINNLKILCVYSHSIVVHFWEDNFAAKNLDKFISPCLTPFQF